MYTLSDRFSYLQDYNCFLFSENHVKPDVLILNVCDEQNDTCCDNSTYYVK